MTIMFLRSRCHTCGLVALVQPTSYQGDPYFDPGQHPRIGCPRDGESLSFMSAPVMRFEPVPEQVPPTVHVLRYGNAVCWRMNKLGPPSKWPHGHVWVGEDERDSATCPECLDQVPGQLSPISRPFKPEKKP
jgi:hypothetical protein